LGIDSGVQAVLFSDIDYLNQEKEMRSLFSSISLLRETLYLFILCGLFFIVCFLFYLENRRLSRENDLLRNLIEEMKQYELQDTAGAPVPEKSPTAGDTVMDQPDRPHD